MLNLSELILKLQIKDPDATILTENYPIPWQSSVKICCGSGHKVLIIIDKIIDNTWTCRNCNQMQHTIQMFHDIAKTHGGKCLSDRYSGLNTHLEFMCALNHTWKATPNNVKNKNSWCPQCKDLFNQERCRVILEILFNKKFVICCPDFLYISETKKYLELDGYCEEIKIAFEYQGIQHYELMYWDNEDESRLKHQQDKDAIKVTKCLEKNITLLVISYKNVKFKDDQHVKELIIKMLKDSNITISEENKLKLTDTNIQELVNTNHTKIVKFKSDVLRLVSERNGTLKDPNVNIIHNRLTKFIVICIFNHEFETTRERLLDKRQRWCPKCSSEKKIASIIDEKNLENRKSKNNIVIIECDRFGECKWRCKKCKNEYECLFTDIPDKCNHKKDIEIIEIIDNLEELSIQQPSSSKD